jgi:diguanylate cyclase (GGDEF)-like protein
MKDTFFTKKRLITILTIILLFTFTFTSLISYNVTKESITANTKTKTLPLISDNIFSEIQQELISPINNSSLMANDEFLIDWVVSGEKDADEIVRYLNRIIEKYGYFSSFFVSNQTGNYYYYGGILKQISPQDDHDIWYYRFRDSNMEYALDVDTDEATDGTITIFINHRLEDNLGNFLGVTGIGLEMVSISDTLASYRERYGHVVYMIDSNGLIQVHADQNMVEKVNIKDLEGIGSQAEAILSKKTGTNIFEFKNGKRDIVISSRYFPDFDWYLIVEQDETNALSSARNYLVINIAIGVLVTLLVILLIIFTVNLFHNRLEELAINDDLTGLFNRRKFAEIYQHEKDVALRYGLDLGLLFLDIDNFKSINDAYGHQVGDTYLRKFTVVLQKCVREIDTISRWGGEEFVILLHRTNPSEAAVVAERLRTAIEDTKLETAKGPITRTISIGIAASKGGDQTLEELIGKADQAMLQAKQAGRNQSFTYQPPEEVPQ